LDRARFKKVAGRETQPREKVLEERTPSKVERNMVLISQTLPDGSLSSIIICTIVAVKITRGIATYMMALRIRFRNVSGVRLSKMLIKNLYQIHPITKRNQR
jgi:hypothetical protein